jgi:hypothetical protein
MPGSLPQHYMNSIVGHFQAQSFCTLGVSNRWAFCAFTRLLNMHSMALRRSASIHLPWIILFLAWKMVSVRTFLILLCGFLLGWVSRYVRRVAHYLTSSQDSGTLYNFEHGVLNLPVDCKSMWMNMEGRYIIARASPYRLLIGLLSSVRIVSTPLASCCLKRYFAMRGWVWPKGTQSGREGLDWYSNLGMVVEIARSI